MKRICITLAALLPLIIHAEEIVLNDGRRYPNFTIIAVEADGFVGLDRKYPWSMVGPETRARFHVDPTTNRVPEPLLLEVKRSLRTQINRVEPDGLVVTTDAGVEKIPFLSMSEEIQQRYGFDLKKLDQYRAEKKAAQAVQLEQQKSAILAAQQRLAARKFDESRLDVEAIILQVLPDGGLARLSTKVKVHGTETVTLPPATGLDKPRTIQRPTVSEEDQVIAERVMIYALPKGLVDGDAWKGPLWPAGTYSYGPVEADRKTIRAYATSQALAVEKLKAQE